MSRKPEFPIEPFFADRWSPRSFTGEPVSDEVLKSAFEAARWAPSAVNAQPWRFLIARPGDALWETYVELLHPRNRAWGRQASALILILSARHFVRDGETKTNIAHSFDAGAAWSNFAHQALLLGWHTHGIGGFDRAAARDLLQIPEEFALETFVALGRQAGLETLAAEYHEREAPNARRPIHETVFAGKPGTPAFAQERDAA